MSDNVWNVPATIVRVIDADTMILELDLGWHIRMTSRCRLIGINTPEMSTEEGQAARAWVMNELSLINGQPTPAGLTVQFISHKLDKYGRPLGQVWIVDAQGARWDLGSTLLAEGLAVPMG